MRKMLSCMAVVSVVVVLSSCASTEVTSVWRDSQYQGPVKKVLVVGILKNMTNRRVLEDEFAYQLKKRGVDAVPGYIAIPGDGLPQKDAVAEAVSAQGFDSLLLVRLVGEKTERNYIPGMVAYSAGPSYRGWPGYYGAGYTRVYSPGYSVEDKFALAEANLYDAATEKIIWTAASQTWIRNQDAKLIRNYVSRIMGSMRKQRVLP